MSAIDDGTAPACLWFVWIILSVASATGLFLAKVANAQFAIHAAWGDHLFVF